MNNSQLIRHKFLPQLACYNIFKTYQFKEVELNVLFLKEASEVLNTYKTIQFHNFYKQSKQKTTSCEILKICKKRNYPNQSSINYHTKSAKILAINKLNPNILLIESNIQNLFIGDLLFRPILDINKFSIQNYITQKNTTNFTFVRGNYYFKGYLYYTLKMYMSNPRLIGNLLLTNCSEGAKPPHPKSVIKSSQQFVDNKLHEGATNGRFVGEGVRGQAPPNSEEFFITHPNPTNFPFVANFLSTNCLRGRSPLAPHSTNQRFVAPLDKFSICSERNICQIKNLFKFLFLGKNDLTTNFIIVRPCLNINRYEIKNFCNFLKLPVYPDKTNQLIQYSRNRIRKQILPIFRFYFNPQIDKILCQFIEILNKDYYFLNALTNRIYASSFIYKKKYRLPYIKKNHQKKTFFCDLKYIFGKNLQWIKVLNLILISSFFSKGSRARGLSPLALDHFLIRNCRNYKSIYRLINNKFIINKRKQTFHSKNFILAVDKSFSLEAINPRLIRIKQILKKYKKTNFDSYPVDLTYTLIHSSYLDYFVKLINFHYIHFLNTHLFREFIYWNLKFLTAEKKVAIDKSTNFALLWLPLICNCDNKLNFNLENEFKTNQFFYYLPLALKRSFFKKLFKIRKKLN